MYKYKGNNKLYDEWMKLSKKTTKKITAMNIISQFQMEATREEFKEWFETSMEEIVKVDQEFKAIITQMLALRMATMEHIREQIKEQN